MSDGSKLVIVVIAIGFFILAFFLSITIYLEYEDSPQNLIQTIESGRNILSDEEFVYYKIVRSNGMTEAFEAMMKYNYERGSFFKLLHKALRDSTQADALQRAFEQECKKDKYREDTEKLLSIIDEERDDIKRAKMIMHADMPVAHSAITKLRSYIGSEFFTQSKFTEFYNTIGELSCKKWASFMLLLMNRFNDYEVAAKIIRKMTSELRSFLIREIQLTWPLANIQSLQDFQTLDVGVQFSDIALPADEYMTNLCDRIITWIGITELVTEMTKQDFATAFFCMDLYETVSTIAQYDSLMLAFTSDLNKYADSKQLLINAFNKESDLRKRAQILLQSPSKIAYAALTSGISFDYEFFIVYAQLISERFASLILRHVKEYTVAAKMVINCKGDGSKCMFIADVINNIWPPLNRVRLRNQIKVLGGSTVIQVPDDFSGFGAVSRTRCLAGVAQSMTRL